MDEERFNELYRAYAGDVLRVSCFYLGDRQKAISYYERYLKESDPENTSSQWVNARIKFLQAENFMQ